MFDEDTQSRASAAAQITGAPQAVILAGRTPGLPLAIELLFLDLLIANLARHGFRRVVLLAGCLYDKTAPLAGQASATTAIDLTIVIEPEPAGTGGALLYAQHLLDDRFLLLSATSLLDINYLALSASGAWVDGDYGIVALHRVADGGHHRSVVERDGRITQFLESRSSMGPALVDHSIYWLDRSILKQIGPLPCSIEHDVLPRLAGEGRLAGQIHDGNFIEATVITDLEQAQATAGTWKRRPAAFLDRDGVINQDIGYAHRPDQIIWTPDVAAAIRYLNEAGYFVFVVTNQAGIARALYDEQAVLQLHAWMQRQLRDQGAHIDDWRYCPDHPDATVAAYRRASDWRKPQPGMIWDLARCWPIDMDRSFLIGDRDSDLQAAAAAGVPGHLVDGTGLLNQVRRLTMSDQGASTNADPVSC